MSKLTECCYDYRYERQTCKPVKECAECGEPLYEGDKVYVIGNKIYCDDCVRYIELEKEG